MSRWKIMTIILAVALLVVLFAVFRSCRSGGQRPPAERGALEGTSYRADAAAYFEGIGKSVPVYDLDRNPL